LPGNAAEACFMHAIFSSCADACRFHCLPLGNFYELASNLRLMYVESHNRCYSTKLSLRLVILERVCPWLHVFCMSA
jgi:hypothetical protein